MFLEPIGALQGIFTPEEAVYSAHGWRERNVVVTDVVIIVILLGTFWVAVDHILVGRLVAKLLGWLGGGSRTFFRRGIRYNRCQALYGSI